MSQERPGVQSPEPAPEKYTPEQQKKMNTRRGGFLSGMSRRGEMEKNPETGAWEAVHTEEGIALVDRTRKEMEAELSARATPEGATTKKEEKTSENTSALKSQQGIAAERLARIAAREKTEEETGMRSLGMTEREKEIMAVEKKEQKPLKLRDRLDMLRKKAGRFARAAVLSALTLVNPGAVYGTSDAGNIGSPKDAIVMRESGKETSTHATKWPGLVHRFFEKNEQGKIQHNPWFWLAPFQFVWKGETEQASRKTFAIPYEYSRQFDVDPSAKNPLRPEDHEKVGKYLDQQLKRRFVDTVTGWGGDVDRYQYGDPQSRPGEITSIRLTGFASPEGPMSKGPATLAPGNIDEENLRLAKKRAESALGYTKNDLLKISETTGIAMNVLEQTLEHVRAKETQFSNAELTELAGFASGYQGADDLEKIYNMIGDYNSNKIKNEKTLARLHDIVGSKRKVEITVTYDGKNEERHPLPIPWLPLLMLVPLMRRRRGETPLPEHHPENNEPVAHHDGLNPPASPTEEIAEEPNTEDPRRAKALENIHQGIIDTHLPKRTTVEFQEMEEATYIDDLNLFFDDPESIRLGINYRQIADELDEKYEIFKNSDEKENYLASEILNSWKRKDRLCRVEAGIEGDGLDAGLDYENQQHQIQWAKMHARSLLLLVEKRKELSTRERQRTDYLDLLSPQVKKMIQRRGGR